MERSLILIKPTGVQRGLVGAIIKRFEQKGYKLIGMRMLRASEKLLQKHYAHLAQRSYYKQLLEHMKSGPVIAMVWAGCNVIRFAQDIVNESNPVGYGRNVADSSASIELAHQEIPLWFEEASLD